MIIFHDVLGFANQVFFPLELFCDLNVRFVVYRKGHIRFFIFLLLVWANNFRICFDHYESWCYINHISCKNLHKLFFLCKYYSVIFSYLIQRPNSKRQKTNKKKRQQHLT
ncbi:hypothetical protein EGW08_011149 [Elysia chlorotica]|uniref:Uncharacterized protein n=1 Tax=Elysia chlorotica TaxID=188477 RepID=A0A433THU9_ELYCH|nr:hypothetical protein EGW08_011149 [Elysia chlorotica]